MLCEVGIFVRYSVCDLKIYSKGDAIPYDISRIRGLSNCKCDAFYLSRAVPLNVTPSTCHVLAVTCQNLVRDTSQRPLKN